MKRNFVSALAVLLTLLAINVQVNDVRAQDKKDVAADGAKPVVAVALPSYEALLKDIGYIGKLVGTDDADKTVQGFVDLAAGGLEGLDKSKPTGFVVTTDGASFTPLIFVPVSDVGKLLKTLEGRVKSEDAADGVKKLTLGGRGGQAGYLKTKAGWAFLGMDPDALGTLPDDPLKWLGGVEKEYDIAARFHLQNIPDLYRQFLITGIEQGVKTSLKQKPEESAEEFAARKKVVQGQIDSIVSFINDMDQLTIGWNIDATAKKIYFDFGSTVLADSKTAKKLAEQFKDLRSEFGGFLQDDAVFSLNGVSKMTEEDAKQTSANFTEIRKQLIDKLQASEDFENDAQKAKVKEIANKLMDVVDGMIKGGKFDAGMAVLGEGPFTLAFGMHVPDGAAADKALRDVVKLAEGEGLLSKVEFDAEKAGDLTFHRISPKLGEEKEKVAKVLGDDPKFVLGIGKSSVYLAVGTDGVKTLQGLIEKSKATASKPTLPVQMSVALAPIINFAAKENPFEPMLDEAKKAIAGGQDHIRIQGRPITNGEIVRIEIEEGVVKLIGAGVKGLAGRFLPGAGAAKPAFPGKL